MSISIINDTLIFIAPSITIPLYGDVTQLILGTNVTINVTTNGGFEFKTPDDIITISKISDNKYKYVLPKNESTN